MSSINVTAEMNWLIKGIQTSALDSYKPSANSASFELSFFNPVANCFL
jgi:hypothetical protein